ncbi:MAG: hypothetical protein HY276_13410 [Ignavibacteriales bacterium]|nr:hypothetical protein [Ignavibacteriales bacterium]
MTRLFIILSLLVFLLPRFVIAQNEIPWLSLSRLSISASTSYHFSPWKKYNESLQLAQDAIRYDPTYAAPKGSFEKILGDGSIELSAGYRLIEGLSINVIGGYTATSSEGIFSHSVFGTDSDGSSVTLAEPRFIQNFKLNVVEYGFGIRYTYEITEGISLAAGASASQAHGRLNFEYEFQRSSTTYSYSVEMQEAQYSYRVGLGMLVNLYGPISLNSSIEYRWLKFPNFQGDGTYREQHNTSTSSDEYSQPFQALLGESDGYFGIHSPHTAQTVVNEHLLHILWQRTSVWATWYETRKPATLDLSGVGVKIGIQVEF